MPSTPKEMLQRHGLKAKHSWGQSFLGDPTVLDRIAKAASVSQDDVVVELGAGLGHLTRALLATGARVVAVERDRDLVKILEHEAHPKLKVLAANAAELQFAEVAEHTPVVIVGNLPYHLTSPILFSVLEQARSVSRGVFTIQKEVAERLSAAPGNRQYGLLTVLLGLYFELEYLFTLNSQMFYPPPQVDSAVIRLDALPRPRAEVRSDANFRKVVKAAFAQRRKTLLNSLQSDKTLGSAEVVARALDAAGIDRTRRAETLAVEEFAALERAFSAQSIG